MRLWGGGGSHSCLFIDHSIDIIEDYHINTNFTPKNSICQ